MVLKDKKKEVLHQVVNVNHKRKIKKRKFVPRFGQKWKFSLFLTDQTLIKDRSKNISLLAKVYLADECFSLFSYEFLNPVPRK